MRGLVVFCLLVQSLFGAQAYVGYSKSGGRFGDNVLCYLHAKWLSYKYELPLLYTPFKFSSELVMDDREMQFGLGSHYGLRKMPVRAGTKFDKTLPMLYDCPYFPALESEQKEGTWQGFFVDWKDPVFRGMAREMVAPKRELDLLDVPKGYVSVAIHVREGGGFDTDHTRLWDPLKLPPLEFYLEALSKVFEVFPDGKIYCHLFTDAEDVGPIARAIEGAFPLDREVVFEFRKMGNHHTMNVLEDFFSLFLFDVLIRPRSNFSIVPELLHDYAAVFFPEEFRRTGTLIEITKVGVSLDEERVQSLRAGDVF